MNLDDWLLFVQIVDFGGLSAASRRLGIPKSTLSRRLARLEFNFGSRLLARRGRVFELTDDGRLFYQEARSLTEYVHNATERLAEKSQSKARLVKMTAPKATGGTFLGSWLAEFLKLYPHIQIELDLSDHIVNMFERGYDLALRVGPLPDSSLVARTLGKSERFLVAATDYIDDYGQPASPEDLTQHKCVGFGEQRSGLGSWVLTRGKSTQRIRFKPILQSDDMTTTLRIIQSGTGVAMIPAFVCQEFLDSGELQRILPTWSGPVAEFFLVYPERELMPKHVRLLIDFLAKRARSINSTSQRKKS